MFVAVPFFLIFPLVASALSAIRPTTPNSKVKVIPECGKESITVRIKFADHYYPNGRFTDWIIVGDNGRSECRLQGNGETEYIVQIAIFNDPCDTQMPSPGEFQNTLRIAQFPGIILQDDLNFTFKCLYGHPEVSEFQLPQVSPSFDVNRNLITVEATTIRDDNSLQLDIPTDRTDPVGSVSKASENLFAILLSAFVVFALLVFLLILYICLRQFGGTEDKHREQLDTPSTHHDEDGSPWWRLKEPKIFESGKAKIAPHIPGTMRAEIERAVDVGRQRDDRVFRDAFRDDRSPEIPQTYSEWREKTLRGRDEEKTKDDETLSGCLTPVRSITEIYRTAETRLQQMMSEQNADDEQSESSIEGEYSIPIQRLPFDKETKNRLGHCVDRLRGFGAKRLTEQELGRWRHLIANDAQLQNRIAECHSVDDLRSIAELSEYRLFFTRIKWTQIMDCVWECLESRPNVATLDARW